MKHSWICYNRLVIVWLSIFMIVLFPPFYFWSMGSRSRSSMAWWKWLIVKVKWCQAISIGIDSTKLLLGLVDLWGLFGSLSLSSTSFLTQNIKSIQEESKRRKIGPQSINQSTTVNSLHLRFTSPASSSLLLINDTTGKVASNLCCMLYRIVWWRWCWWCQLSWDGCSSCRKWWRWWWCHHCYWDIMWLVHRLPIILQQSPTLW